MRSFFVRLVALSAVMLCPTSWLIAADDDDWTPLFNGRDLSGWHVFTETEGRAATNERLVRVDDGEIHFYPAAGDSLAKRGYLATDTGYSFYRLRFEYRWGDAKAKHRDSGVLVHVVGEDTIWPTAVQCQVQEGKTANLALMHGARGATTVEASTASTEAPRFLRREAGGIVYAMGTDEATRRVARQGGAERDGWNQVEITVAGGTVTCTLNDEEVSYVTDLRQPTADGALVPLTAGRIAFQAESAEVFYRKIEVEPIWGGAFDVPVEFTAAATAPTYARPELIAPPGFEITTAVAPPLVRFPMMACLDDRGRLFVCEAAGVNLFGPDLATVEPNSILLVEDADGDGVYDKSQTFADRMTFPSGCVWHGGALYVASAPYIWRLRDADGDGIAEERTQLVGKFEDSGIADSLHGPFFAPDGRLYWVHGIGGDGHEVHDAEGKLIVKSDAPGIFSCRPDGTDIRKHCAGGMNNPVELDFTDSGQMIGTVNLLKNSPRDDALVQWVWGGLYPHNQGVIEGLPRTGELLDSTFSFGHVAVSGLTRLRSAQLGNEYRDSFLVTQFNTQRVVRVNLTPSGSTYRGEQHEFLASPNTDVHFTDVMEDADGSVLVIDTGGWFRNGCPTSQIAKPNVLGAIYRIRRAGAARVDDPRGETIDWNGLSTADVLKLLDDERAAVRERAIENLSRRDGKSHAAILGLGESGTERARLGAIAALCRKTPGQAGSLLLAFSFDSSPTVREAAVHGLFCLRDPRVAPRLRALLADESPSVRRESATALGYFQDQPAVPALLNALAATNDRLLEHALIYALIEINDPEQTAAGLSHASPLVQRGALIALDQMPAGGLKQEMMAPLLDTVDPLLQQAALEIISRRPGWADATIGLLGDWLGGNAPLTEPQAAALRGALTAFASDAKVQGVISEALADKELAAERRLLVLEAISRMSLAETPESWPASLAALVRSPDASISLAAMAAARSLQVPSLDAAVSELAHDKQAPTAQRIAAIEVLVDRASSLDQDSFQLLVTEFRAPTDASGTRPERLLQIARTLAKAPLTATQRRSVAELVSGASPLTLPVLLGAFDHDTDTETGQALVAALQKSDARSSLPLLRLEQALRAYPAEVQRAADGLLAASRADAAATGALLDQLAGSLDGGDVERGRAVFFGNKAACSACHRRESQGGNIGPDLSQIGRIRTRRDLVEAVKFPSASFARGFEPVVIATRDGLTHQGVIGGETGREVTLRTGDRAEIRIPRDEIDELQPSPVSIMPQGLDTVLTQDELRDLLAYLGQE